MRPTRWTTLVWSAAATTVVVWAVLRTLERSGQVLSPVPLLVSGIIVVMAVLLLWLGWTVRQFLHGKRPDLTALRAARTVVLAKASCYTGSLLLGWYGAQVLLVAGDLAIEARRARALAAGLAALSSVLLVVVGLVVERFCRLPPPSDDDDHRGGLPAPSAAA